MVNAIEIMIFPFEASFLVFIKKIDIIFDVNNSTYKKKLMCIHKKN